MTGEWDARTYDRVADPQARWGGDVVDRLGEARDILDAGCGSGRVTEQILRRCPGARVVALDGSARMLDEARRRLEPWQGQVSFVQADLAAPLPPIGSFDTVVSTAVFHWVRDHDLLFRSLGSVLRPGGRLVAQWGGHGNITSVVAAMRAAGLPTDRWTFATEEETVDRLRRAGFADVRVWSHPEPVDFGTRRDLEEFLESVILVEAMADVPPADRRATVTAVADGLASHTIDYVRINVDAVLR